MKRIIFSAFALTMVLALTLPVASFARFGNSSQNSQIDHQDNAGFPNGNDGVTGQNRFRHPIRHANQFVLHRLLHCLRDLNLSDETKASIQTLLEEYKTVAQEQNQALKDAYQTYWEVLTSPVLDQDALAEAQDAVIMIKTEKMETKFDLALNIRNLLTDEELAELSTCFDFTTDDTTNDVAPDVAPNDDQISLEGE